jgi:transketolase
MSVVCPGTATEFDTLFKEGFRKNGPKYFRLSEVQNELSHDVRLGQANVVQQGSTGLVIAVGPMFSKVMQACNGKDVSIVYYTSISPFDGEVLRRLPNPTGRIVICEPYYSEGGLAVNIVQALEGEKITIKTIGIPTVFSTNYGAAKEHDAHHGLDADSIRKTIHQFFS